MEPTVFIAALSILISAVLALINIRKYLAEQKLSRRVSLEAEFRAPAERDSIIVSGAKEAVLLLKSTLVDSYAENEKLRARLLDTDARVTSLEKELARLHHKEGSPNDQ